jgi:hypothetical protein
VVPASTNERTFLANDSAEVDVVAVAERPAVGRDALAAVATRVLVNTGVDAARTNALEKTAEAKCDQGCQIFLGAINQVYQINMCKIYQMATKYIKWRQNIPNNRKIYQMASKYTKLP